MIKKAKHMKSKRYKNKFKYFLIIYSMIFTFAIVCKTNAKYLNSVSGDVYMKIANPVIELIDNNDLSVDFGKDQSQKITKTFYVRNYDNENNVSESAFDYKLIFTHNIPEDSEYILRLIRIEDSSQTEYIINNNESEKFTILNGSKIEHNYKIEIILKTVNKNIDNINLHILLEANQTDIGGNN